MEQPTVTVIDCEARVQLSGEFAMEASFIIEPALERMLTLPSVDRVVLDLSALSFIDSVGMSVVIRFADDLQARVIRFGSFRRRRRFIACLSWPASPTRCRSSAAPASISDDYASARRLGRIPGLAAPGGFVTREKRPLLRRWAASTARDTRPCSRIHSRSAELRVLVAVVVSADSCIRTS